MPLVAATSQLSEMVFGGVGAGLYGMLIYFILSVFIAGLMVWRTPNTSGKKIQAFDVQMAMLSVLIFPLVILMFTAISSWRRTLALPVSRTPARTDCRKFSTRSFPAPLITALRWRVDGEYVVVQLTIGVAMLFGRYFMIIPLLAIAGNLAARNC